MSKLYKTTDRIPVQIDDITVEVSPLTFLQKSEIQSKMSAAMAGDTTAAMAGTLLCLRYAVKSISGVETSDGKPYELSFENDQLSDESVDDLLNLEINNKLVLVCTTLINGISDSDIIDPSTRQPLEGVKFNPSPNSKRTQKKK